MNWNWRAWPQRVKWIDLFVFSFLDFLWVRGGGATALLRKKERTKRKDKWINEWSPSLSLFNSKTNPFIAAGAVRPAMNWNGAVGLVESGVSWASFCLGGYGRGHPPMLRKQKKTSEAKQHTPSPTQFTINPINCWIKKSNWLEIEWMRELNWFAFLFFFHFIGVASKGHRRSSQWKEKKEEKTALSRNGFVSFLKRKKIKQFIYELKGGAEQLTSSINTTNQKSLIGLLMIDWIVSWWDWLNWNYNSNLRLFLLDNETST